MRQCPSPASESQIFGSGKSFDAILLSFLGRGEIPSIQGSTGKRQREIDTRCIIGMDNLNSMLNYESGEKPAAKENYVRVRNAVTMQGTPLTLVGNEIKVGDKVRGLELMDSGLSSEKLSFYAGKIVVIASLSAC
jgi:hypothetical protein